MIKKLKIKEVDNLNLDDSKTTLKHQEIIQNKKILKEIYIDFYSDFVELSKEFPDGKIVEIGSGGGFLKELIPNLITTDILELPNVDIICSAENLPFENQSIDSYVMLNVLHHIKNPRILLNELSRTLKKGGKVRFVEPANTIFSRFIYQNLHHEDFNPKNKDWKIEGDGPMSDANGAIPWIIFKRDYKLFETEYSEFRLNYYKNDYPFRYLLSGGVSMNQLIPNSFYPTLKFVEKLISPANNLIGMFTRIEIEKI